MEERYREIERIERGGKGDMAHSGGKPMSDMGLDTLSERFRNTLNSEEEDKDHNFNKPDFRELDLGSPVSPLRTRPAGFTTTTTTTTTTTSSSSSSSGSVSGRNAPPSLAKKSDSNHSGELSGSVESSPTARFKPGHRRSDSCGSHPLIYSGSSSVTSPPMNVLPTGNICPSGKILKTGMSKLASKTDVLGSGTGNYGHGSIMRGGSAAKLGSSSGGDSGAFTAPPMTARGSLMVGESPVRKAGLYSSNDPEELKRIGNDNYKKGHFSEALSFYDKAIAISPGNAAYHCNRAAALIGLKRLKDAVRECEEAIRLDPAYVRAHHRLGSLLIR